MSNYDKPHLPMWKHGQPPEKDFYAVIFSSTASDTRDGYKEMDELTLKLAQEQPGFLGYESAGNGKQSIFISYWESMEAINNWRQNAIHLQTQSKGTEWYDRYLTQICKVEHSRLFEKK